MKDKLITALSTLKYPVYLQGSLASDQPYPDAFFTFWNNTTFDHADYDNGPVAWVWSFDVNFYARDPALVNSVPLLAIDAVKAAGFIVGGRAQDLPSDQPDVTGRGFIAQYIERKETLNNGNC